MKEYCGQLYTKLGNLEEIDKFLENAQLTKTDPRRNRKCERSILNKEVDLVFFKKRSHPRKEIRNHMASLVNSTKCLNK